MTSASAADQVGSHPGANRPSESGTPVIAEDEARGGAEPEQFGLPGTLCLVLINSWRDTASQCLPDRMASGRSVVSSLGASGVTRADRAHHVPSTPKPNIGVNYIWRWIPPSCLYNEHSLPNYAFGILDLTVAVTTGFITSPSALFNYEPPNELISAFPLVLIPVYLVPLSILLHLASLKKLRRETAHTSIVATASARTSSAPQMFVVSS
jgi:hypothetical protein